MRLALRFVVPLLLALAGVAWALVPLVDRMTLRWFTRDLDVRAALAANSVDEGLQAALSARNPVRAEQLLTRLTLDERMYALGYCASRNGRPLATRTFPAEIECKLLDRFSDPAARQLASPGGPVHVTTVGPDSAAGRSGWLIVVHDMSFISRRSAETRRYLFYVFVGLGVIVSLITVTIAQVSWRGWVAGFRALTRGEWMLHPGLGVTPAELRPVAQDLRSLIRDIEAAHRLGASQDSRWDAAKLRGLVEGELRGQEVIVLSNRQPYHHVRVGEAVEVRRPASGLVTALEPIVRACGGTWIAHGSGSADADVVDLHDRVAVPAGRPEYSLRRVWLTPGEENGYYYGFANEGLWPLCHIAHVRPLFRIADWEQYVAVNRKFAEAVAEEARTPDPVVLVQDYHLALVPRMIRELLPSATTVTFWHIPWPNPEAFAICPWREEILDGLLGSTILGFHTQFHCNNFLESVERLLEARIDRETQSVSFRRQSTSVRHYPISLEWPTPDGLTRLGIPECRALLRAEHGLPIEHFVAIGVDRLDYTKGIEERFRAVECLLERHPEWIGKFSLIQLAAPSRSSIDTYANYEMKVRALAAQINERFARATPPPIVLRVGHSEPPAVYEAFRGADLCLVTSLHDGMNLVAKEFVASRDDERGVLVLSRFTGAARELPEALIVNPYDAEECGSAIHAALTMHPGEQRDRMRLMRGLLEEFNVYRWAARMLLDSASMRRRAHLLDRSPVGGRA